MPPCRVEQHDVATGDTLAAVYRQSKAVVSQAETSATFIWPVRVYYEDTDAGGIVYYANYLKFFERCRTEWLRSLGIDPSVMAREHGLQFVVAELQTRYLRSARLDDELAIEARVTHLGHCSLTFEQRALLSPHVLAQAQVRLVCVDIGRQTPSRLPSQLTDRIPMHRTDPESR